MSIFFYIKATMYRSSHPYYTALMVQRVPHTVLLNPVYQMGVMSGRGWFSRATKKIGRAIKSTKNFVKKAVPIVQQVYNDPAVQKLLNNTPVGAAIDKGIDTVQSKYSTIVKPYQDLYNEGKNVLAAANQLSALPVVGPAIGYALTPANEVVNNVGDPLNQALSGNGARRGRSRVSHRGRGGLQNLQTVPMSTLIANAPGGVLKHHRRRT